MLRGAISGFGEVAARAHLAGWDTRQDVRIVAIHDPLASRRHAAINLMRHVRVYDDLDLMLAGEGLDFVDIASPPAYHVDTARRALAAGAHVLIEKPLCLVDDDLIGLREAAGQARRVLMCVHNWKHAPGYRRAHELITANRLGEIAELTLERLRTAPAGDGGSVTERGARWRIDSHAGGGILIDHGWHVFYLMSWLLNGARPVALSAELGLLPGTELDDHAIVKVDFGKSRAEARLSWRSDRRATTALIKGNVATLSIMGNTLTLRATNGDIEDHSVVDIAEDSYHPSWFAGVAREFVEAVEQGFDGPIMHENLDEAAIALALINGARGSAQAAGKRLELAT